LFVNVIDNVLGRRQLAGQAGCGKLAKGF